MLNVLKTTAAISCLAMLATGASAATITVGADPLAAMANPLASSTTGTVAENTFGSNGTQRSPWDTVLGVDHTLSTSLFTSVGANSTATYDFDGMMSSVSFLWGSPDSWNDLVLTLSDGSGTDTINGVSIDDPDFPAGRGAVYVTITADSPFSSVTFQSGLPAFEYANLSTVAAVPLPAGLPLMLVGLASLGVMGRRRRNAS